MSFWGVEVKPGNPITYSCSKTGKRIRITQATLGEGDSMEKSLLQCTVGKRSPVFLCALLPNNVESCKFGLEFEEPDDVVFSVIGRRSIYLAGYYVHKYQTESQRMDTESTESKKSSQNKKADEHADGLNNDTKLRVPGPSPASCTQGKTKTKKKERDNEDGYLLSIWKDIEED